ncbi:DUF4037 domain-containing protein [Nocardioides bigeumensis]|uniref:DUF4037 domain-containing protein n=1 Tax=Nocardioides bigeumensis TaxID=433657 RepID=A0ABP5JCE1_9ACTN
MVDDLRGRELCRAFFEEHVAPALDRGVPGLPYAAALLGRGSEVLGYDDELSRDHNHEARVVVLVRDEERTDEVAALLEAARPERFLGRPTEVAVTTPAAYVRELLAVDLDAELDPGLSARDWLTIPEQQLVTLTSGAVFHDDIGLDEVRARFAYYPRDVWLFLMAATWWRLHPEGNLVGRIGHVGDELGSTLLGARLVEASMRLCFLMERTYAPYVKWFGTAFSRLACAPDLTPPLTRALRADRWPAREAALSEVYRLLGAQHDRLNVTAPVPMEDVRMWDRPFTVPWGDFPEALLEQVTDPEVRALADAWPFGGADQVREVLWTPSARPALLRLLE